MSELAAMQDAMMEGDWLPDLDTELSLVTELMSIMFRHAELENALTWETTCLNCASLLDKNYEQYVKLELIAGLNERYKNWQDWANPPSGGTILAKIDAILAKIDAILDES